MTDQWLSREIQRDPDENQQARLETSRQITEEIRGEVGRNMRDQMGLWKLYECTENPSRLRIMVGPDGQAAASLELRPDGALRTHRPGWIGEQTSIYEWTGLIMSHIRTSLERKLTEEAIRLTGIRLLSRAMPNAPLWENVQDAAGYATRKIINEKCGTALRNGKTVNINPESATQIINRIIRDRFTRKGIEELARQSFNIHSPYPSCREYNEAARNHSVFQKVLQESPHVLHFYCNHVVRETKSRKFRNAGELTAAVQQAIGIQGAQWAIFVRLGNRRQIEGIGDVEENVEAVRLGTQVLLDANCPGAPMEVQQEIMRCTHLHQFYQEGRQRGEWRHGDPWRAWVHLLNQGMQHCIRSETTKIMRETIRIEDALRWNIQHQQTWGPTSWENYQRRSERWHEEEEARVRAGKLREAEGSRWESLLGETTLDGFTVHPVTNGAELLDIAWEMGNCLATYRQRCEQGTDRIFTVLQGDQLMAAGQLVRTRNGEWREGQLEGPARKEPDEPVREVFRKTAELYRKLGSKGAGSTLT